MALSTTMKTDLYRFFAVAFDAAPGATYMTQLAEAANSGMTIQQIVEVFTTKPQFTSVYPNFFTNAQFADKLIETVVGASATAEAKTEAKASVEAALALGGEWTRGKVIYQIFNNLANKAADDATWGATSKMMANQVAYAQYYTEVVLGDATDMAPLRAVIANVTATSGTTTADLAASLTPAPVAQTFKLTTGADSIVGGAGADTIIALSINADGADASTLTSFDSIDGGAGTDTLNIYTDVNNMVNVGGVPTPSPLNDALPGTSTVKNVEIVNIYNIDGAAALADASKFEGVTQLWQHNEAAAVTKLAATTTAGFKTAQVAALDVTGAATAAAVNVALDGAADADVTNGNAVTLNVAGAAVNAVNVSGTIAAGTNTPATKSLTINVTTGKNVKTIAVNTAIDATVTVAENLGNTGGTVVTAVDFAASAGGVTFVGDAATATITSGAGKDTITVATTTAKDVVATAADETITATVTTGAGNDSVTVNVTGDGKTNVTTGAGDDTVAITGRGTSVLTVDLGEGADTFTSGVAIAATDSIDAGAGSDTLLLSLVGSANVAAFKNFDVYDVKAMAANLDLDILNAGNTVTEIIGSAALGGAVTLQNVTTNFRATGDMGVANALTLTQKTAGALTVTLDADETGTADAGDDVANVSVAAAAATSVSAVFDTAYLAKAGDVAGETAADNVSTIALATQAATAVSVVSGGAFSKNVLNVTEAGADADDKLAAVTVTGAQALTLSVTGASKLASVDASAATGGLTATLADLKNGGNITLGSGTDKITATNTSTTGAAESITGFAKTAAVAVSAVAADAVAKAAAIAAADVVVLAGAQVANASAVGAGEILTTKGVLSFTGSGPATLAAAIAIADANADAANEAVAFEYLGNSYVFVQGGATDTVVKLTGITGVTNFVENGVTDAFFIV